MKPRTGLTHVETLAMLVVGGLFVTQLLPSAPATGAARAVALEESLEALRTGIEMYRFEHEGRLPAAGSIEAGDFETALLRTTDADGNVTTAARSGPYVVGQLPANPFNGLRTVRVVSGAVPEPNDRTGWTYDSDSGAITANTAARTASGRRACEL